MSPTQEDRLFSLLAELSTETIARLNEILPPHRSHQNPIDILGDAPAERYVEAVELAESNPATDGLLAILAPQAVADPATVAKQLTKRKRSTGTPIIAGDLPATARAEVAGMMNRVRSEGRELLTEAEPKNILAAYGIPAVPTEAALSAEEAIEIASRIGYPVVLKLHSKTITHKTDVGGVELNMADARAVREAYAEIERSVRQAAG